MLASTLSSGVSLKERSKQDFRGMFPFPGKRERESVCTKTAAHGSSCLQWCMHRETEGDALALIKRDTERHARAVVERAALRFALACRTNPRG